MGEFFTSFEQSWRFFERRRSPLEVFSAQFPETEGLLAGWYIALDEVLAPRIRAVQALLADIPWLMPYPAELQHVWLASLGWVENATSPRVVRWLDQGRRALCDVDAFRLAFPRLNAFHNAVVVEVEATPDILRGVAGRLVPGEDQSTFLPHLALSLVTAPGDPGELRDVLRGLRDTDLGEQQVDAVRLGLVPLSRRCVLAPWVVAGSVRLLRPRR